MRHRYGEPGRKIFRGVDGPEDLFTATGVGQGDPLAGAIYSVGQTEPLDHLVATHPYTMHAAYFDVTYVFTPPENVDAVMSTVT